MNRHMSIVLGIALVLVAVLLTSRLMGRARALSALAQRAEERAVLVVEFATPQPGPAMRSVVLPGSVGAWHEAPIFAQVSGYVHDYRVDYGAKVKGGQLVKSIGKET